MNIIILGNNGDVMKLIVGLGNPGREYDNTRHNVGFKVLDNYLKKYNINYSKKFDGLFVQLEINNEKVIFLKPQKYMNLSGEVVRDFVRYYKINIEDILIINDDLDISLGKYKLKASGSSGGHNGLKNIENNLGTNKYKRLKIGISNDKNRDTKDYVLGKFNSDELSVLNKVIDISEMIINDFLLINFDLLMTKYNNN